MDQCTERPRVDFVLQFRPASAPMTQHEDPKGNRLLAALRDADCQRWHTQLECVELTRDQVLY